MTCACHLTHPLSAGGFDDGRSFSDRRRAARSNLERTSFDVSIRYSRHLYKFSHSDIVDPIHHCACLVCDCSISAIVSSTCCKDN